MSIWPGSYLAFLKKILERRHYGFYLAFSNIFLDRLPDSRCRAATTCYTIATTGRWQHGLSTSLETKQQYMLSHDAKIVDEVKKPPSVNCYEVLSDNLTRLIAPVTGHCKSTASRRPTFSTLQWLSPCAKHCRRNHTTQCITPFLNLPHHLCN